MKKKLVLLLVLIQLFFSCGKTDEYKKNTDPGQLITPVNVYTDKEGVYRILLSDLIDIDARYQDISTQNLSLFHRGIKIPMWIEGKGEDVSLIFFAKESDSLYTKENIIQLRSSDQPDEIQPENGSVSSNHQLSQVNIKYHSVSLFLEENKIYQPQVNQRDHWLWLPLLAPAEFSYDFLLDNLLDEAGSINIQFWGSTESNVNPDHHFLLYINGQLVLDQTFDGKGVYSFQANLPKYVLKNGKNKISIQVPGKSDVPVDFLWLDWIRIIYPINIRNKINYLDILSGEDDLSLTNFHGNVDIFDVTDPDIPLDVAWNHPKDSLLYPGSGKRLIVVDHKGFFIPSKIEAIQNSTKYMTTGEGADLLFIGPIDLLKPLIPLKELRIQQGLTVKSIPIQTIYDQFYDGLPEPEAIRSFLRWAQKNWHPAPKYVLLVGDASYDPKGYSSDAGINKLPTFFINSSLGGETASDLGFSTLEDSNWNEVSTFEPRIAIGRIPAQNSEQVKEYVEKVLAYEQILEKTSSENNILAIADGQDQNFTADANSFLTNIPASLSSQLFTTLPDDEDAHLKVIDFWNNGFQWIVYFGHGSIGQWGKDSIFSTLDIPYLKQNNVYPFIINMTCLSGFFTHPEQTSLMEMLILDKRGGTLVAIAPTSLTLSSDQGIFLSKIIEGLKNPELIRFGDLVLNGWMNVPTQYIGAKEVRNTFLLFGDPSITLPLR